MFAKLSEPKLSQLSSEDEDVSMGISFVFRNTMKFFLPEQARRYKRTISTPLIEQTYCSTLAFKKILKLKIRRSEHFRMFNSLLVFKSAELSAASKELPKLETGIVSALIHF